MSVIMRASITSNSIIKENYWPMFKKETNMSKRRIIGQHSQLPGIFLVWCMAISMVACATFESPSRSIQPNFHEQLLVEEKNDIRVSAAIVDKKEEMTIFGIDLSLKNVQAIWVKIENSTNRPLRLLPTAIDSEYFTPSEVAYTYKSKFSKKSVDRLVEHLEELRFPVRNPILPGTAKSGYIFTNLNKGMKIVDIDLVDHNFIQTFTLFLLPPGQNEGQRILAFEGAIYSAQDLISISNETELRKALEQLPCCASEEGNPSDGEPLNAVIIGMLDDWVTGFIRRGYHYQPLSSRYVFGRTQDISGMKKIRGYTSPQQHFVRIWKTPIVYNKMPVWLAQLGTFLEGRFSRPVTEDGSISFDPHIDEIRYDILQDLVYSQNLKTIGFVKGAGRPFPNDSQAYDENTPPYITDGLRAVMVFSKGPVSLEEIGFLNWEKLEP